MYWGHYWPTVGKTEIQKNLPESRQVFFAYAVCIFFNEHMYSCTDICTLYIILLVGQLPLSQCAMQQLSSRAREREREGLTDSCSSSMLCARYRNAWEIDASGTATGEETREITRRPNGHLSNWLCAQAVAVLRLYLRYSHFWLASRLSQVPILLIWYF